MLVTIGQENESSWILVQGAIENELGKSAREPFTFVSRHWVRLRETAKQKEPDHPYPLLA